LATAARDQLQRELDSAHGFSGITDGYPLLPPEFKVLADCIPALTGHIRFQGDAERGGVSSSAAAAPSPRKESHLASASFAACAAALEGRSTPLAARPSPHGAGQGGGGGGGGSGGPDSAQRRASLAAAAAVTAAAAFASAVAHPGAAAGAGAAAAAAAPASPSPRASPKQPAAAASSALVLPVDSSGDPLAAVDLPLLLLLAERRLLLDCLEKLKKIKSAEIFMSPVTEEEAPGYTDIIKNPCDLTTLKDLVDRGAVSSMAAFREKIELIVANCRLFNDVGVRCCPFARGRVFVLGVGPLRTFAAQRPSFALPPTHTHTHTLTRALCPILPPSTPGVPQACRQL
jgi:hypothetical protein